ncbi:MAG: hypothetical protein SAK29_10970 [Scytonema sp. PMC 1069.18]|nr:hypothetical protein [Scytonema sp. PMC 1069.18]MEC4881740.1 hypothetical protein [Scytonema sp. PMC 1070.18]
MEPTIAQLRTLFRVCVQASNLLQDINMTRYDERTNCIYMIVEDTIEVEIGIDGRIKYDGIEF